MLARADRRRDRGRVFHGAVRELRPDGGGDVVEAPEILDDEPLEIGQVPGRTRGALTYPTYSTITGRPGVHLEGLFIAETHRGRGWGEQVLKELADQARRDGGRLERWVLRTNEAAHRFYRRPGAREVAEIGVWRLEPAGEPTL
ncbi:GNAT family N-acetyltransferase [Kribbella sp. DT2]|uniref:GNAT family N-acetyltransferase n=1 Tax=Kribbella sp. DT2 TaxID=3393427 RepID=UPI003CF87DBE